MAGFTLALSLVSFQIVTYEQWLAAYLSVLGISLTILGVVIAVVALWGYWEIKAGAIKKAEELADRKMRDFLAGEDLKILIKQQVDQAADLLWDDMRISGAFPPSETQGAAYESKPLGDQYPGGPTDVR
ncbi:MAG: hypothetical protein MUF01_01290 [Bryobacterales bacterium]|nr:hypothetical protein [Bryobacterales bacterium]